MDTLRQVGKIFGVDPLQKSPILLLDKSRVKDLPRLFKKLGLKTGAEIGTMKGWYAGYLFKLITG